MKRQGKKTKKVKIMVKARESLIIETNHAEGTEGGSPWDTPGWMSWV